MDTVPVPPKLTQSLTNVSQRVGRAAITLTRWTTEGSINNALENIREAKEALREAERGIRQLKADMRKMKENK